MYGLAMLPFTGLICVDPVEPGAVRVSAIGVDVRERGTIATGIPLLAARDTGMAPDAGIQIDDKAELLVRFFGQHGHRRIPVLD
jgi:hypothetical protein